jgi:glycosyltransferase involved in cell wall biosynthesis
VIARLVFLLAAGVIVWVYVGYPIVLAVAARLRRRAVHRAPIEPSVTLIVCAYNEVVGIRRKLEEIIALDYPPDRLELILASDGSTDGTDDIVREFAPRVSLLRVEGRGGKTVAQNVAVAQARGEILIFSDVTTVYAPHTIRTLVSNFADPSIGCVGGDLRYESEPQNPSAEGRALFWSYERRLRLWESQIHSVVGVAGCSYAMRRSLYQPLDGSVISDFVQPGLVTTGGHRTIIDERAPVYEPVESYTLSEELYRRARIITRGLRGAFAMRELLDPIRYPWLATVLWSHRVLRWLVPIFLLFLLAAAAALAGQGLVYDLALWGQLGVYAAGGVALGLERLRVRPPGMFIPLYFCLMSLAPLVALGWLLRGEKKVVWETAR